MCASHHLFVWQLTLPDGTTSTRDVAAKALVASVWEEYMHTQRWLGEGFRRASGFWKNREM